MATKMGKWFLLWIFSVSWAVAQVSDAGIRVNPLKAETIVCTDKVTSDPDRLKDRLTADALSDLPIGIARKYNETVYVVAIDSARSDKRGGWRLNAYMAVTLKGATRPLAFAGKNVHFGKGGLSLTTSTRLELAGDQYVEISENIDLLVPGDGSNYIEFDCNGFKSIHLKGKLIFSDSLMIPDYKDKKAPTNDKNFVTATFEIHTNDLNNILINTSITPFRITSFQDMGFEVQEAVLDWSDFENPKGYSLPAVYQNQYGANIKLWRGFYLKKLQATYYGNERQDKKPLTFTAENMLIDDAGVSGMFSISNLLPLSAGSANGWPISIETLYAQLTQNKLTGGGLGGEINIPFLGEDAMKYTALMRTEDDKTTYTFAIDPAKDKLYSMPFGGTLKLAANSRISIEKSGNDWHPKAELHGEMSFVKEAVAVDSTKKETNASNDKLSIPKVSFQDLTLTTDKPYLVKGTFSLNLQGQARLKNFPIALTKFKLGLFEGRVALEIGVALGLQDNKGVNAETVVYVAAAMEREQGEGENPKALHKWRLEKIKIKEVDINCNTTSLYMKGTLAFFDKDVVYGDGFRGRLELKIPSLQSQDSPPFIMSIYFGSLPTYRYWQFGVAAPVKIPVAGAFSINGIMLGAAYHMKKPLAKEKSFDLSKVGGTPTPEMLMGQEKDLTNYVPDESVGISLLAGVSWTAKSEKACNGDAILEIAFNAGGGVRYIRFDGAAYFMTTMQKRGVGKAEATNVDASLYAKVSMTYDHPNHTFHANMSTYINAEGAMKGTAGAGGLAGQAIIHIDPQDWYIYIGKPSQRFGVDVVGLVQTQSYLMIGSKLENLPLPPPEVMEVFEGIDMRLMRDDIAAKAGNGFAMGIRVNAGGEIAQDPIYFGFTAGGGFDAMIRDLSALQCQGRDGKIGIDGWYASGQAYLYLKGRVSLRLRKRSFDIVKLAAAAILQAKLPNPSWMRGALAGNFSILGGLVKGNFNVGFTIGQACTLIATGGKELDDIKVIEDIKPELSAQQVSVFSAPQVTFNTPIGAPMSMENLQGVVRAYRIVVDDISLKKGDAPVEGTVIWNANKDVATFKTQEILPPNAALKFTARVHWEKQTDGGWERLPESDEAKEHDFQTGNAPDFVPDENIAYAYPVKGQYHFHKAEHGQGYVMLKVGQQYLFPEAENEIAWAYYAKFVSGSQEPIYMPLAYQAAQKAITYNIPASLQKERGYKLTFIKLPKNAQQVGSNVARGEKKTDNGSSSVAVAQVKLTSMQTQAIEKILYRNHFRTSKFDSFGEKYAAFTNQRDVFYVGTGYVYVLGKNISTGEVFDQCDLRGTPDQEPLVQVLASSQNNWLMNYAQPTLYDGYPLASDLTFTHRNPAEYGITPLKAVALLPNPAHKELTLTEQQAENGQVPTLSGEVGLSYFLSTVAQRDHQELRNKLAQKYFNAPFPASLQKVLQPFVDVSKGQYPVFLRYKLPGQGGYSTERVLQIQF